MTQSDAEDPEPTTPLYSCGAWSDPSRRSRRRPGCCGALRLASKYCLICKITINLVQVPKEQASNSSSTMVLAVQPTAASSTAPASLRLAGACVSSRPAGCQCSLLLVHHGQLELRLPVPGPLPSSGASASSAKCKPDSRNKPTQTAIQISDADRRRRILITEKCTTTLKK
jgi:hypothetical protein